MKSINPFTLSLAAASVSLGSNAMGGTILVDFTSQALFDAGTAISTSTNFAAFDDNVDLSAGVFNLIPDGSGGVNLDAFNANNLGTGDLSGVTITSTARVGDLGPGLNGDFFGGNPILSDFGGRGASNSTGLDAVINLAGFSAVEAGSTITLTVFGANVTPDGAGQNNNVDFTYNGSTESVSGPLPTIVDGVFPVNQALIQFTATAVEGVDELSFLLDGNGAAARNFAGFSITTAVPEPASLALVGLGGLAMLGRRRKG